MTIKSDIKKQGSVNSFSSWWKYTNSEHKIQTIVSLGIFWDFRNEKPKKKYVSYVDKKISKFKENINLMVTDGYYLQLGDDETDKFWIANKYYGWHFISKKGKFPLTIKQIAQVDNLLQMII